MARVFKHDKRCKKQYSNILKSTTIEPADTVPTTTLAQKHLNHKKSLKRRSVLVWQDHLTFIQLIFRLCAAHKNFDSAKAI